MKQLGLYLHIPFCKSKCLYCDFCSIPHAAEEQKERYVAALCRDLEHRADDCRDYRVDTVYLGGGTPTVLSAKQLHTILDTVQHHYRLERHAEITAECNPATADRPLLAELHRQGLNRLSIGLQSAHRNELKALGRLHSYEDFLSTWEDAQAVGFGNLSADIMFGIPEQTVESYLSTVEQLCALSPQHISAYSLMVEEGTPFFRMREKLSLPDEDETLAMYRSGIALMEQHGLRQYEISNFAKEGYASRHNLKYWRCEEYLGFGPAAHSDFSGKRFGNVADVSAYPEGGGILAFSEQPSRREREQEFVMLGMRTTDGISNAEFQKRFGRSLGDAFGTAFDNALYRRFLRKTADGYAFTQEGLMVSNTILSDILDFSCEKERENS